MDDHQILQTRQLKARLESIATAGEILRVSLGATTLADAVRTVLLGLYEIFPAGVLALFEVHDGSLIELGRLVEGEQAERSPSRTLSQQEPAMDCIQQHRHLLVESAPSLIGPDPVSAVFLPFEGRLGELSGDATHLRASHLLWVESPEHPPSPEELDTLIALASQAGVLLTGFRYRDDLERTYSALREANKRLQKDIDRARKIQEGLLPQATPVVPGHLIDWKYLPAEKVSGDYFDCFPLDPKDPASPHCVVIADVSGHGISASMVMAMFKVLLRREMKPKLGISETLEILNRTILAQVGGLHFVTVFLALIDPIARCVEWSSAGHCPQLLRRKDGSVEELSAESVFVGMFDDFQATSVRTPFQPGDTLLLYTDGITEAEDAQGELYGMDRLKENIVEFGDQEPSQIIARLLATQSSFSGPATRPDDLTLVVIRSI
ncbi:MAG: serine/threonine-protein phosphatase [Fibrobacterota bacterium]|nr:serine/threonine-protein phosphatase [Fibrobacterota bacterium]QQS07463.1 MAG: serine/threonine-protein phosphatase [Fibrobacterota bacterium]